jgi:hypothetical protein
MLQRLYTVIKYFFYLRVFLNGQWLRIFKQAMTLWRGLDNRGIVVRFPVGTSEFSHFQIVQTHSWDPPSLLFSGYWGPFPWGLCYTCTSWRAQGRFYLYHSYFEVGHPLWLRYRSVGKVAVSHNSLYIDRFYCNMFRLLYKEPSSGS